MTTEEVDPEFFYEVTLHHTIEERPIFEQTLLTNFALSEVLKNFFDMDLFRINAFIANAYAREGGAIHLSSDVPEKRYALVAMYKGRE